MAGSSCKTVLDRLLLASNPFFKHATRAGLLGCVAPVFSVIHKNKLLARILLNMYRRFFECFITMLTGLTLRV